MHRRLVASVGLLSSILVSHALLVAQTPHPLGGTWKVNVAKSKYDPANLAPKSTTVKYEVTGDAIKAVIDGVDSQGRATHSEYAARFDGKDYPWKGTLDGKPNTSQDAVNWRKIDDRTYETLGKLKGQVLVTQRTVLAPDGKSRTTTTTGKNAQGQTLNHVVVLEKQ